MIYLDEAATTKPKEAVIESMIPYLTEKWYNPSSLYSKASEIKRDIERARKTIADFINANPNEIFFTSSGSEGNCWAIQGFINESLSNNQIAVVVTSSIEHKSIKDCLLKSNVLPFFIKVDRQGFIDMDGLEQALSHAKCSDYQILVSVQFANNEIGTIQHIREIADMTHKYNALFHTDAVQAFGKIPINVKDLNIDMMTVSGHKIGTPKGVGFLYKKNGIHIQPLIYGNQEQGLRGGTENVFGIIGLSKAIEYCDLNQDKIDDMCAKRDYFINWLESQYGCKLNGHKENRLPNNINVTFPQNITGESLLYMLDMSGVQVSTGSACNSTSIESSHVLKAIGLTDEQSMKTIRFSLSDSVSYENIDYVIGEIDKCLKIIEA